MNLQDQNPIPDHNILPHKITGLTLKLKVCGLTKIDQIKELISLNVDFLGFIFYPKSLRYVLNSMTLSDIAKIEHPGKTGVFVNEGLNEIIKISQTANLNFIQLHGDEDPLFVSELRQKLKPGIEIIKVIRIGEQTPDKLQKTITSLLYPVKYFLFDTDSKAFGGTGKTFNWSILNNINIPIPYFLSGGISTENINEVLKLKTMPIALDINSKFETEHGIKDITKIKNFKKQISFKVRYVVKKADDLSDPQIDIVLKLWDVEEWKTMDTVNFKFFFHHSEFHFLLDENDNILCLLRLNFDFKLEIKHTEYSFSEMVGLVAASKGNGYGSLLLQYFNQNIISRKLDVISFCEAHLRDFYIKNKIEILENKAKFIKENYNGRWITTDDDDLLILNLSKHKTDIINQLNEKNIAHFIN